MPRDGSGVYSPDWVNAAPNTTIESAKQNAMVADLVADANAARPITAGGTGAATAAAARTALAVPGLAVANAFTASQTWAEGAAIASASTLVLGTDGNMFHVTGTIAIGAISGSASPVTLVFDGALSLTHNSTTLILPGGATIVTAAGDTAVMVSEGSGNWRCISYQRAAQLPDVTSNAGVAKCWAYIVISGGVPAIAASHNVTSVTDTGVGQCTVTIETDFLSINWASATSIQSGSGTTVFSNYSNKTAGSIRLLSISLADAFADPDAYNFVGFGAQ